MVEVTVRRSENGIEEVVISGHANAGKYGSDIVCSAVSAISFGILNSIYPLLGIIPEVQQAEQGGGFLRWRLRHPDDEQLHEKQQLLAESMAIALLAVSEQNGKFISVHDPKWQGGAT